MADTRINIPGTSLRAANAQQQAKFQAAERLLGEHSKLDTDAVFCAILDVIHEVTQIPMGERTEEQIEAAILSTSKTIVQASALAIDRHTNPVRKGGRHD